MFIDKLWEKVARDRQALATSYNTDVGDNKYIVVLPDGKEIRI